MASATPHARGDSRLCPCGAWISGKDTHPVCVSCLGTDHARLSLSVPGSCVHCKQFTTKSLRRRLARQASLSGLDPLLTAAAPAAVGEDEDMAEEEQEEHTDWVAQPVMPAVPTLPSEDVLELEYFEDDSDDPPLISESEGEDDPFITPVPAAKPGLLSEGSGDGGDARPTSPVSVVLLDTCKRAAASMEIPWPTPVTEPSRSRYEGRLLSPGGNTAKQLLPIFPDLLLELTKIWSDKPYSGRNQIPGASVLDTENMEALGLFVMPPVEPPVAVHLYPGANATAGSSRRPSLPNKPERLQSALTERAYKQAALSMRALSVLSLLSAYQAEILNGAPSTATWREAGVITDLCLHVQRVAVLATGKAMASLVVQERARWLNLAKLTDRERDDILDAPVIPGGIFGSALTSMQERAEAKKKDNEAFALCLPRRAPSPSPTLRGQSFAQAAAQPPRFKIPKRPQHQPGPARSQSPAPRAGWKGPPGAPPAAPPPPSAASAATPQGRRKKKPS